MSCCCCCQAPMEPCQTCRSTSHVVSCCGRRACQCPLSDALTPYPDEIIMTILDRILYFFGATKICHQPGRSFRRYLCEVLLYTPPPTAISSCRSPPPLCAKGSCTSVTCTSGQMSKCTTSSSTKSMGNCKSKSSNLKSKCSVDPSCCSGAPRTTRVDFAHPVCDKRPPTGDSISLSDRMKMSLSHASIAYRRLKSKLSANLQQLSKKWLWTRLVRSENGCHIYEVYKNSTKESKPCGKLSDKEPVILFLVMPNGQVMPFESLSSSTC